MGIHASSTEVALQTGSDALDDNLVSSMKLRDARSDLIDYTDAFVAENAKADRINSGCGHEEALPLALAGGHSSAGEFHRAFGDPYAWLAQAPIAELGHNGGHARSP